MLKYAQWIIYSMISYFRLPIQYGKIQSLSNARIFLFTLCHFSSQIIPRSKMPMKYSAG